jgi:pyruvate dehydrogenase E2 component (dihydrolipoamide acetyltransferase)
MVEFCMPSLGADMEKATLVEWKVAPGDRVQRGDIIAEVETDKGVIEIEVFVDGVVEKLLAEPGDEVPVGGVLALIRAEQDEAAQKAPASLQSPADAEKRSSAVQPGGEDRGHAKAAKDESSSYMKRLKISPAARKKAAALGLDPANIRGTGPEGAINLDDVQRAGRESPVEGTSAKGPSFAEGQEGGTAKDFQLSMRRAISAAMARSKREIPHYYLETRIDMSQALQWLTEENARRSIKDRLLPAVLLIQAAALALTEVPALNGYWTDNAHHPSKAVHIGFAIALRQGGLVAPAIHDADQKGLDELMQTMRDLIARTRAGKLRGSEMTDATITLTNLGDLGVERSYGVIYPPQVALVSFGKIMDQPWAENGMLGIRPVVSATLSGDHRATDGRTGAQFLNALNRNLQQAGQL